MSPSTLELRNGPVSAATGAAAELVGEQFPTVNGAAGAAVASVAGFERLALAPGISDRSPMASNSSGLQVGADEYSRKRPKLFTEVRNACHTQVDTGSRMGSAMGIGSGARSSRTSGASGSCCSSFQVLRFAQIRRPSAVTAGRGVGGLGSGGGASKYIGTSCERNIS
jgi:hypothetical protein